VQGRGAQVLWRQDQSVDDIVIHGTTTPVAAAITIYCGGSHRLHRDDHLVTLHGKLERPVCCTSGNMPIDLS
jgi:hypothetical protein